MLSLPPDQQMQLSGYVFAPCSMSAKALSTFACKTLEHFRESIESGQQNPNSRAYRGPGKVAPETLVVCFPLGT